MKHGLTRDTHGKHVTARTTAEDRFHTSKHEKLSMAMQVSLQQAASNPLLQRLASKTLRCKVTAKAAIQRTLPLVCVTWVLC